MVLKKLDRQTQKKEIRLLSYTTQENLLKIKLENIFHKQILLRYVINPQIIGGLVIKYGTSFIDNSVRHKLNALEQLMKGTK